MIYITFDCNEGENYSISRIPCVEFCQYNQQPMSINGKNGYGLINPGRDETLKRSEELFVKLCRNWKWKYNTQFSKTVEKDIVKNLKSCAIYLYGNPYNTEG